MSSDDDDDGRNERRGKNSHRKQNNVKRRVDSSPEIDTDGAQRSKRVSGVLASCGRKRHERKVAFSDGKRDGKKPSRCSHRRESKCSHSRHYSSERSEFDMSDSDSDDDVVDTTLRKPHVKLRTYDGTTS